MTYSVDFRRHVLSIRAKEGLTLEQTSRRFGVGRASFCRWLKRLEPDQSKPRQGKIDMAALAEDVCRFLESRSFISNTSRHKGIFMRHPIAFYIIFSLALGLGSSASSCEVKEGAACQTEHGEYSIRLPEQTPKGAIVFLHGFQSSSNSIVRNENLVNGVLQRGYALIAPNGSDGNRTDGGSWNFAPDIVDRVRDDDQFMNEVARDAAEKFDIPRDRMMLAGFSEGGFMTSYLACRAPESFAAYAPVAGGFWRPEPEVCAAPVRLYHTHGWADAVVPLEGRWLRRPNFAQGDIFSGLEIFRAANECTNFAPDLREREGEIYTRSWKKECAPEASLVFTLFPGGHQIPSFWSERVIVWFEQELPPSAL